MVGCKIENEVESKGEGFGLGKVSDASGTTTLEASKKYFRLLKNKI